MTERTSADKTPLQPIDPWPTVSTGPTMTIDDAIRHLSAAHRARLPRLGLSEGAALNLGIQALRRLQDNRRDPGEFDHYIQLPGETVESMPDEYYRTREGEPHGRKESP